MAEKSTKLLSAKSDYALDDGLDIPDYHFDFEEPKKNDHPILSTFKEVGKGALGSVFNKGVIRSTIKNSLPDAYGTAYDFYDRAQESTRTLYNDAARELRPANSQLKQITRRYLPQTEGILPKKIGSLLKGWSAQEQKSSGATVDSVRSDTTAMELGQIFKAQAEDADRRADANQKRDQLNQGIEQIRHRDVLAGLNAIDINTSRLAAYQDNVLANYQKKSLELQFRQYYATADILHEIKKKSQVDRYQLEAIVKNTGLSDYAKLKTSDALKQATRNKFLETAGSTLFGGAGGGADFIKRYVDNIKKSLGEKLKGGAETAGGIADMLDLASSTADTVGGMGGSKAGIVGGIAGGIAGDFGVNKAQKWLRTKLEKNPQIQKGAQRLQYGINNAPNLIKGRLNDPEKSLGPLEFARGFLQDNLPGNAPDTTLDTIGLMAQNQPAIYSNAAQKSIVEVIPGLLARIQRELVVTRTGQNADLVTYDYKTNKFSTTKAVGKGVLDSLASDQNKKDVEERLETLLKRVDPTGQLHPDDSKALKDKLLDISLKRESSDPSVLVKPGTFNKAKDPKAIAKAFQDHFQTDEDGKIDLNNLESLRKRTQFSDQLAGVTKYFNDPRAQIQEMARLGQTDALEQSGVFNRKDNRLDLTSIGKSLRGETLDPTLTDETYVPVSEKDQPLSRRRRAARVRPGATLADMAPPAAPPVIAPPVQANVAPLVQNVKVDNTDLLKALEAQTEAIHKLDASSVMQKMLDQLVGINEHLAEGINTYSLAEDYLGSGARQRVRDRLGRLKDRVAGGARSAADALKQKLSFKDITLGQVGGAAVSGAKTLFGGAFSAAKTASTLVGGVAKSALSIATTGAVQGSQAAADYFGDVWVKGESIPRLTRGEMKAGLYFDKKTGKPIKSLKDLSGDVVDKDGNILLSAADIENSYVKGTRITALKQALGEAGSIFKGLSGLAMGALGGVYGTLVSVGISAVKGAIKLLPPYDVYVKTDMTTPLLYARGFKGGEYFDKESGHLLAHPRDINGEVIDKDGNILVSKDHLQAGLVDVKGITVTNKIARLFGKVGGLVKGAIGLLKGVAGNAKEFLVGIGQGLKDIFGGMFGLRGEYLQTSLKQLDVQTAILQLLTARLPPPKKRILGDENGDGIREGSGEEQLKAAEAADKAKREGTVDAEGRPVGPGARGKGGLLGGLAGLFGGKKKKDDDEKEGKEGYGVVDQLEADAAEGAGKSAWKFAKGRGIKGMAKLGLKGLGAAGAAYGAYSAYDNVKKGNYGEAALDAAGSGLGIATTLGGLSGAGSLIGGTVGALGTAAGVLGSAAATVGGAALSGGAALASGAGTALGAGATALGAAISAPVVLTALGVAAVGAGAYYGYKYLTRAKLDTLSTVRYAQYGFAASDKDHFNKIIELEEKLNANVKLQGEQAQIAGDKLNLEELAGIFGIKARPGMFDSLLGVSTDSYKIGSWSKWFNNRFKPIYLAHQSVLRGMKPGVKLSDVDDKLSAKEALDYLNATTIPNGPYSELTSPFEDLDQLTIGADGVSSAIQIAQQTLQEKVKKDATKPPVAAEAVAAGAGVAATGAAAASTLTEGAKTATGTGTGAAAGLSPEKAQELSKNLSGTVPTNPNTTEGSTLLASNTIPSDYLFTGQTGRVDALTSIRYKTYGLVEMDAAKMKNLRYLEMNVAKNVKFGPGGASYEDEIEQLLTTVKGQFGITGVNSERGIAWVKWFRNRFLPVFLNYKTAVGKITGKKDNLVQGEMDLTPQQQFDVANAVITTSSIQDGSRIPVWKVSDSPWDNYDLNSDDTSVKLNLEFLTQAIKAVKLGEQMSTKVQDAAKAAVDKGGSQAANGGGAKAPDAAANAPGGGAATGTKAGGGNAANTLTGLTGPSVPTADAKGTRAIGDFVQGAPIEHPGKGTGGDINSIPVPTADGYNGMKDMLAAVAKVTGMPLSSLTTTAAVESNFRASAVPGINRITGKVASGAVGLFQFIPSTWNTMLQKYGAKYGIAPGTPATDARANALMGAEFMKENLAALQSRLKRPVSDTDLYLAHFLGAGGAAEFLNSDPNAIAATSSPGMAKAAAANSSIFYDKDRNGAPRTFAEIHDLFTQKINKKKKEFNLGGDSTVTGATPDAKSPTAGAAGASTPGGDTTPSSAAKSTDPKAAPTPMGPPADLAGSVPAGTATAANPATPTPATAAKTDAATGASSLVASATPAGTTAGTSSTSGYGGSIATVRNAQTPTATPTGYTPPADTPAAPVVPIVRANPNYAGFAPNLAPTAAELGAQSSAASAAIGGDVKTIAQTLLSSLQIQTDARDILKAIAATLGSQAPSPVSTPATASNDANTGTGVPRPALKAPISMARAS